MNPWLRTFGAAFLAILFGTAPEALADTIVRFTLDNVQFSDGSKATGYFTYDLTNNTLPSYANSRLYDDGINIQTVDGPLTTVTYSADLNGDISIQTAYVSFSLTLYLAAPNPLLFFGTGGGEQRAGKRLNGIYLWNVLAANSHLSKLAGGRDQAAVK